MAKAHTITDALTIEVRATAGTTSAKAVRRAGNIPAVLYGHGAPTPISVTAKALEELLTFGGKSHILDATIDGRHDSVLLRDVQRHPVSHRPIHADFQRVSKGEAISATIPLSIVGTPAPVKDGGAVLDIVSRTIEVKGPADRIPESLSVDVAALGVHSHVSAAELTLPAGFTLVTPADQIIVSVEASRTAAAVEEVAPVVAEPAAPADGEAAPAS